MKTVNLPIFSALRKFKNRLFLCNSKQEKSSVKQLSEYKSTCYDSISNVDVESWDELADQASVYFNRNFLRAIEQNNLESIEFRYLIFQLENDPIAIACIQIMDFSGTGILQMDKANPCLVRSIGNRRILMKNGHPIRMLICGNAFVSGEHGLFIKPGYGNEVIIRKLSQSLHKLSQSKQLQKQVDAIVVKDFSRPSIGNMSILQQSGYHQFNVEPNMVLPLHPSWNRFEDYLKFMKTKFRTKAKSAFKKSNKLQIKDLSAEEIWEYLPQLTKLYRNVQQKAEFNLGVLKLSSYAALKTEFGVDFILRSYWLEDEMVGFLSGLINRNALDAHFVGINYRYNKQYGLYQRMLYDYVRIGIDRQVQQVNFGRTASEIKSTIGAIPEELTCYAKHRNPVSNQLVKPLFNFLRPTDWEQRLPFKDAMMKTS